MISVIIKSIGFLLKISKASTPSWTTKPDILPEPDNVDEYLWFLPRRQRGKIVFSICLSFEKQCYTTIV